MGIDMGAQEHINIKALAQQNIVQLAQPCVAGCEVRAQERGLERVHEDEPSYHMQLSSTGPDGGGGGDRRSRASSARRARPAVHAGAATIYLRR